LECDPTMTVVNDTANPPNGVLITLTYPNTPICGSQAGATLVLNETVVLGVWIDTNVSSPAYNSVGVLRPNNNTIYFAEA